MKLLAGENQVVKAMSQTVQIFLLFENTEYAGITTSKLCLILWVVSCDSKPSDPDEEVMIRGAGSDVLSEAGLSTEISLAVIRPFLFRHLNAAAGCEQFNFRVVDCQINGGICCSNKAIG